MEMKRKLMKYLRPASVVSLGAVLLAASGCVKRELEVRTDEEGSVEIALDWSGGPSHSARFLFYNEAGALVKEVSGVTDCFKGSLPTGNYRLIVHNTDATGVDWRGTERYESAEVFVRPAQYTTGYHPGEGIPCIGEPGNVFAAGACNGVEMVSVRQSETTRLSVTPLAVTRRLVFRFEIDASSASASVNFVRGVLSGVRQSYFPGRKSVDASSSCGTEFTVSSETKAASAVYTARVNVFGVSTTPQSPAGTNTVHVTLSMSDGSQVTGTFDITPILQKIIEESGDVVLPVEEILLEVALTVQETALSATVEPWSGGGTGSGDPRPQE